MAERLRTERGHDVMDSLEGCVFAFSGCSQSISQSTNAKCTTRTREHNLRLLTRACFHKIRPFRSTVSLRRDFGR